ncbi:poly(U)-specific 3'-to-5' RNA exonuclease [Savitreella phatthalungensis]
MTSRLVEYASSSSSSSSSSESVTDAPSSGGLPRALRDLYTVEPGRPPDPGFHNGRVRSVEGVRGLWPTHLSIEVLEYIQVDVGGGWHPLTQDDFGLGTRPLHISLTTTPLMVPTHLTTPLAHALAAAVAMHTQFQIKVPGDVVGLENDERTRTFLAVVVDGGKGLEELQRDVSRVVEGVVGGAVFGSAHIHHISIGWRAGGTAWDEEEGTTFVVTPKDRRALSKIKIDVAEVVLKIGNRITRLPLRGTLDPVHRTLD